ncbi:hypothetical protein JDV02_001265 [Purpureocillium takamizusanense]|uniref:N-acetyltransferase domain-containing protein n=1 Tax=Purpureocillium takamizusanense TaxID=2060973 RepID=A0A9Q8V6A7_9HYPO|nr:uncharacterized protein JDV02_001265 [Purpureocillium takamizusanense]UNI14660.1 hypothetical protein JDV02_001265 [Purpureocillium takamizusanense]
MAPAPPHRILQSPNPPGAEPGAVLFETERLIVRRYLASDAPALAAAANHVEVSDFMSDRFPSPYTADAALAFFARHDEAQDLTHPTHAAVLVKPNTADNPSSEPRLIGGLGADVLDDILYRTWSLGYFLAPSAWGRGYATEAVAAFTRWLFATWPRLNRIEGEAYAHNVASQRVLEKSGLRREGVRRGAAEKQGVLVDLVMFGIVRGDLVETPPPAG